MDLSDVCLIDWNGLVLFVVIRINVNQVVIVVIPNYRISAPNFFYFKLFSRSEFSKMLFSTRFSTSLFAVSCHGDPLLTRSDTLLNKLRMYHLPCLVLVICGCGIPMVLYWFIPISSSVLHPKSALIPLSLFYSRRGTPNHFFPVYWWKHLLGYHAQWVFRPTAHYLLRYFLTL